MGKNAEETQQILVDELGEIFDTDENAQHVQHIHVEIRICEFILIFNSWS